MQYMSSRTYLIKQKKESVKTVSHLKLCNQRREKAWKKVKKVYGIYETSSSKPHALLESQRREIEGAGSLF